MVMKLFSNLSVGHAERSRGMAVASFFEFLDSFNKLSDEVLRQQFAKLGGGCGRLFAPIIS